MPQHRNLDELRRSLPEEWRRLPVFSYSQLTTADQCGFLWYIKYGLRLKAHNNAPKRDMGTFTHQFLADMYKSIADHGMTPQQWMEVRLIGLLTDIIDNLDFPDQVVAANNAFSLVQRYCASDVLQGHTPVGIEQHIMIRVITPSGRDIILQGYLDLITLDAQNKLWIWDHETAEGLWPPKSIKMFLQLPVYQILLSTEGMKVHGVLVNRLNSRPYKDMAVQPDTKLFRRDKKIWTPGQLNNIWAEFMALVDDTLDLMEGKRQARRSIGRHCFNCDFVGGCFANLEGEDLVESINIFNDKQVAFRGIPAGNSITLLEDE